MLFPSAMTDFTAYQTRTNFAPTEKDVIISRGPKYYTHPGNERLRRIVYSHLEQYAGAKNRSEKSLIIMTAVDQILREGNFVKLDQQNKSWCDAGEALSREKTSQAFRDALQGMYKSSKESKRKRRKEHRDQISDPTKNNEQTREMDLQKFLDDAKRRKLNPSPATSCTASCSGSSSDNGFPPLASSRVVAPSTVTVVSTTNNSCTKALEQAVRSNFGQQSLAKCQFDTFFGKFPEVASSQNNLPALFDEQELNAMCFKDISDSLPFCTSIEDMGFVAM